jgi:hypothetical protein
MLRHQQIVGKTGSLCRVPLGDVIVTHGKVPGVPQKKTIFCKALGAQISPEVAFAKTDSLTNEQVDVCIEGCNFGCFPIEGI